MSGTTGVGRLAFRLSLLGAGLGMLGIAGWIFGLPQLTRFIAGEPQLAPVTGAALTLLGVGAALGQPRAPVSWRRLLAAISAVFALVVGMETLVNHWLHLHLPLDGLLFAGGTDSPQLQPAAPTALALALLGSGLLALDSRPTSMARPSEWLLVAAALVALTTIVGHVFDAAPLYGLGEDSPIGVSLPGATALLAIAVSLLCARPEAGLMHVVLSAGPGGVMLRRLLMPAVVLPVAIGLVVTRQFADAGQASLPLVAAILAVSTTVVSLLALISVAVPLNRTDEVLEAHRVRLHDLVEQAPDGIFVADLDGRYTEVNSAGCQLLGHSREEIIGKTIFDFIPASEASRLTAARGDLLHGGIQLSEWQLRHRDGHFIPVEVSANILPDGRWQGFVRDTSERKRVEEEARSARASFEGILSTAADAIISIDDEQRIVLYNQGAEAIFGWSSDEVVGKQLEVLLPTPPGEEHQLDLPALVASAGSTRELRLRGMTIFGVRKSGEEFPAEAGLSKLELGGKSIFTITLRDITDRWMRDEAVRLSEALQASPAVVFSQDGELRYQWIHDPKEPSARERLLGKTDFDLLPADQAARVTAIKRGVLTTGVGTRQTVRQTVGDAIKYSDLIVEPLRDRANRIVGVTCVAWDITERWRAEEQQRFLACGGEALMLATMDLEATLTRLGDLAVKELADYFLIEVFEGPGSRLVKVACADPSRREAATSLEQGNGNYRWCCPPGQVVPLESQQAVLTPEISPAHLEFIAPEVEDLRVLRALELRSLLAVPLVSRKRRLGTMCLMTSRSTRPYDEQDLRFAEDVARVASLAIDNAELYRSAQRAISARDQVLGIVAHDLRSPLNGLLMQTELLHRPAQAAERRDQTPVVAIERAAQRMNRLIQDILEVAHLESGTLGIRRESIDPWRLLAEVLGGHRPLAEKAGISLRLERTGNLAAVYGDRDRLCQVFDNLIGNAIKFTAPGGEIILSATLGENELVFSVRDTGPGISPAEVAHLFDRFWQLDSADHRGVGLGLPIVKGLIEAQGGRIWLESEVGKGTTFYFTVGLAPKEAEPPVETNAAAADVAPEAAADTRASSPRCILLVEDDRASRLALGETLRRQGYEVLVAESPSRALELATTRSAPIDALVTDLRLPEMRGEDLAGRLREDYPDLKILYMSGLPSVPADGGAFVQKPVNLKVFAGLVADVIAGR